MLGSRWEGILQVEARLLVYIVAANGIIIADKIRFLFEYLLTNGDNIPEIDLLLTKWLRGTYMKHKCDLCCPTHQPGSTNDSFQVNQDGSAMKTEPTLIMCDKQVIKRHYPRFVRVSIAIPRGCRTLHVFLGYEAEELGSYHPGDVGPDVKGSPIMKVLIGQYGIVCNSQSCLTSKLSGGNCSL